MNTIIHVCNTKADYTFIKANNVTGWQDKWRDMLEGRFLTIGDELVEDTNATIFRLGFSVDEVESAINFNGLTDREVAWRESQPDRYQLVNGEWSEIDGYLAVRIASRLSTAKANKILDIQEKKKELRDAGIFIDGVLYDTDQSAQVMYTQFLLALTTDPTYKIEEWKASGESFVVMDLAKILQIKDMWSTFCTSLHAVQSQKNAEVAALSTIEEVESYDVAFGFTL